MSIVQLDTTKWPGGNTLPPFHRSYKPQILPSGLILVIQDETNPSNSNTSVCGFNLIVITCQQILFLPNTF